MDITKIHNRLFIYLISFKKLLRDTAGSFLLRQWKSIEKENISSIEDSMLPEVLRIHDEGFENQSSETLIKYSKNCRNTFYIIKDNDRIAGYCSYYLKPYFSLKGFEKQSVISSIAIDRNFRGRGFAERLLRFTIKEMKVNGVSSILLYVNANNRPAIQLYEKIGFQPIKRVEDICGQKESCYEMELKLI
ncbi:MAG: GNAT family N-acetyltransferase [Methanosarcina sp.]|jgi:ribosomal-protein-alanine N-acetyltransferase